MLLYSNVFRRAKTRSQLLSHLANQSPKQHQIEQRCLHNSSSSSSSSIGTRLASIIDKGNSNRNSSNRAKWKRVFGEIGHFNQFSTDATATTATSNSNKKEETHSASSPEFEHYRQRFSNEYSCPDVQVAKQSPRKFREVSNELVFQLSIAGEHGAARERLVREVMRVDDIDWLSARVKVEEMNRANDKYVWLANLPYVVGLTGGGIFAGISIPLVFHKESVIWFHENIVKMDPSEIPTAELTSIFTVGEFSWGVMEPILGLASFVLLCAQFCRAMMLNMGLHPYNSKISDVRARRLCRLYPQYDKNIVKDFAKTDSWHK